MTTNTLAGPRTPAPTTPSTDQELHPAWTKTWGPDTINNSSLRDAARNLFRDRANAVGNGGSADILKAESEAAGWDGDVGNLRHWEKVTGRMTQLRNLIDSGELCESDTAIAQELLDELNGAFDYAVRRSIVARATATAAAAEGEAAETGILSELAGTAEEMGSGAIDIAEVEGLEEL